MEKIFNNEIEEQRITIDFYNKKFKELMEKKQENEFKMKRLNNANKNYYITANTILSLAQRAPEIFESSETEEKRQLVNFVFQNLELDGKKLLFKTKTPFERVLEYQSTHNWGRLCDAFRTLDRDEIERSVAKNNIT